jgi:DNA-binding SARP family transcriptional activator/pimeloyl-ACP methyl ester carboxylesterase
MSDLKLYLLGPPRIELDGAPVDIQRRKVLALLIYLAISQQVHGRDALATLFYPENTQSRARAYLRRDLAVLNTSLAGEWLVTDRDTVELKCRSDASTGQAFWLDVDHFRGLVSASRSHEHPPEEACPDCLSTLAEAVDLYTNDFLAGFTLRDSREFDEWQFFQAESLRQELASVLAQLVQGLSIRGDYEAAIPHARRWVALDPLHEPAQRQLMQLYGQASQQAAALRQYEEYVKLLDEELGLPPEEETATLYEAIKAKRILAPFIKAKDQVSSRVSVPGESPDAELRRASGPPSSQRLLEPPSEVSPQPILSTGSGMEQQIRFCISSDGVRLAYATVGEGPVFVKAANWLSHLEFDWNSPVWRHWLTALSEYHTLVRYDERGCGLSDWDVEDFSVDAWVQDLETVVDTLGLDRFPLLGISRGGPVAITYAVRYPERVSHLILCGAYVRGWHNRNLTPQQREMVDTLLKLIKLGWGQNNPAFRQVFTSLFIPEGTAEQMRWFNDLQRISTSPENAFKLRITSSNIDVSDKAGKVTAPTLVLHAREDAVVPFEEGRRLAALIPNAQFVALEGKNHILLADEPAWPRFLAEVRQFIRSV